MDKHLEFVNGQWCVVNHMTGESTGGKEEMQIPLPKDGEKEEQLGSQVYLDSFTLDTEARKVYPYKIVSPMGIRQIDFAPITIFYGNNGCGKSTLLNVIANRIGLTNKTEGNTNAYFVSYVEKCEYQKNPFCPIPDDSVFVRSEDIMDGIMKSRKQYLSAKRVVGHHPLLDNPDELTSDERFFLSRCSDTSYVEAVNDIADKFESNGEIALKRMQEVIMPDSLCFLDEPEVSLSPLCQKELANMIELFAGKLRTQFVIATHSPFFLSMKDVRIYNLDSRPAVIRQWQNLPNMRVYFELFTQNKQQFTTLKHDEEE